MIDADQILVNLTETRNTLAISEYRSLPNIPRRHILTCPSVTKAGVPNNKIFVGEASYARTFHMARDGCWGPMCDFTGSRTQSDALPGRCTKTAGYIAMAELNELLIKASGAKVFHDGASNTDVMLYNGK